MKKIHFSRKLGLALPLVAITYVALLALTTQHAGAFVAFAERTVNQVIWDSDFRHNQSLAGFPSNTRQHIANGAYQWDDVNTGADFDVDETYGEATAYVKPQCFSCNGWTDIPGLTNNLYESGQAWFSATYFNQEWSWNDTECSVDFDNRTADVRVVTTHESGHWIVLDHDPNHPEAVMWPDGACKLTTVADDDNGVKALYGER